MILGLDTRIKCSRLKIFPLLLERCDGSGGGKEERKREKKWKERGGGFATFLGFYFAEISFSNDEIIRNRFKVFVANFPFSCPARRQNFPFAEIFYCMDILEIAFVTLFFLLVFSFFSLPDLTLPFALPPFFPSFLPLFLHLLQLRTGNNAMWYVSTDLLYFYRAHFLCICKTRRWHLRRFFPKNTFYFVLFYLFLLTQIKTGSTTKLFFLNPLVGKFIVCLIKNQIPVLHYRKWKVIFLFFFLSDSWNKCLRIESIKKEKLIPFNLHIMELFEPHFSQISPTELMQRQTV